jgi:methylated-DNA-[protein]-cysteine S-methyltransferase
MTNDLERALRAAARGADDPQLAADSARRLSNRAAREGEADIAFAPVDSPVGTLLAASTPRGVVTLAYADAGFDPVLERLSARLSPRIVEAPSALDDVRRELDEYFLGSRTEFDLPLDWSLVSDFSRRVLGATAQVGYGEVSTYGQIAARAGKPSAARAAGRALGANPIPIIVPCHRVVGTSGSLTGYGGGLERKRFLLDLEAGTRQLG